MTARDKPDRLVVAITGATGVIYGIRVLEELREGGIESDLVMSRWGRRTITAETSWKVPDVAALATCVWDEYESPVPESASLADGMVVAPCSMRTLGAIATGMSDNLIHELAQLMLRGGRRLLLLVREAPLSVIHLENMLMVARAGGMIVPPVPAFYARPRSLDDIIDHTVGRVLDQFGVEHHLVRRWGARRDAE